jgi:hypothetical protein
MPWSGPTSGHITSAAVSQMELNEPNWTPIVEAYYWAAWGARGSVCVEGQGPPSSSLVAAEEGEVVVVGERERCYTATGHTKSDISAALLSLIPTGKY